MLIPRIGMPGVLFCVKPAMNGEPAVFSPAQIVRVREYGTTMALVNLQVFGDGDDMIEYKSAVSYNEGGNVEGTFCYFDEKERTGPRVEIVEAAHDIIHGREIVKAGAKGEWDQLLNTITFPVEFIEGMHPDQKPTYRADDFIDWHVARLVMPKGYQIIVQPVRNDDGRERPDERRQYMEDLMDEWSNSEWGTPFPSTVRRRWARGDMRQRALNDIKRLDEEAGKRARVPMIEDQTDRRGEAATRGRETANV